VTISVSAGGVYTLNQGQSGSGFITNNTGRTWVRFTLSILPSSTAGASFLTSNDLTPGQFPAPTVAAKAVTYANGRAPSQFFPPFAPVTTIQAFSGGTIVVQETPGYM
jgi:hypothetical protein